MNRLVPLRSLRVARPLAAGVALAMALPAAADVVELTTLHTFGGADGATPTSALVLGPDGRLWGTTIAGGASNLGTVYRIGMDGTFSLMHSFAGGTDGAAPKAKLTLGQDGNLYGTTQRTPGAAGQGTIYRITPAGALTTLHVFQSGSSADSIRPGPLMQGSDGRFYGATEAFATGTRGSLYRMDAGGNLTVLHTFLRDETDGADPMGVIAQGDDGNLYGTTSLGVGGSGQSFGTIYQVTPAGTFTTIDRFLGNAFAIGSSPVAGLLKAADGNFYGSTQSGGVANAGTLFRFTPSGERTTLHGFTGPDGGQIESELIQASDGRLYGTATWQGTNYGGTVYSMKPDGSEFFVLHRFPDFSTKPNGLVQGPDGALYGTTQAGTVFRLRLAPGVPVVNFARAAQTAGTGNRNGEATTYLQVTLSSASTLPVEVPYTVTNDSPQMRYTVNPGKLVIPAGDSSAYFVVRTAFNGPRALGEAVDCNASLSISLATPLVNGVAGSVASTTVSVHNDAAAVRRACR